MTIRPIGLSGKIKPACGQSCGVVYNNVSSYSSEQFATSGCGNLNLLETMLVTPNNSHHATR